MAKRRATGGADGRSGAKTKRSRAAASSRRPSRAPVRILPLTPERWGDFEALFGKNGACGGCWCMLPKLTRAQFEAGKGDGNRRAQQQRVRRGDVPGVLAYDGEQAVGWCALEPRADYPWLQRSRILAPVDEQPVWSIVCFFVRRDRRGQGVSRALIQGAVAFARDHGAQLVEAYPQEPKSGAMPAAFAWTGLASAFLAAGFSEVARRSPTRPIMRKAVRPRR